MTSLYVQPQVDVIGQLDEQCTAPQCCYSVDALELLASVLRVSPAEQIAFLEEALVDSRRSAARDLTRSSTASKFVNATLSSFVLDDLGRVNFHAVSADSAQRTLSSEAASGHAGGIPSNSASASRCVLLPRELVVFAVSTVAVTLHMKQAATGSKYNGCISARAVPGELAKAGYWVSATKVGCLTLSFIQSLLQVKLFCRPATGWTGSDNTDDNGVWLPRSLALLEQSRSIISNDSRLHPWISTLPSEWARIGTDFAMRRAFQLSVGPCALLLPKSQLSGRDSLLKAMGVNSGSSIAQRDIYLTSAGVLVNRYECIRSGKPESRSAKECTASTALAKVAVDSLSVLQSLEAEPLDEPAHALVGVLARVSGCAASNIQAPKIPSRAAALGADSAAKAAHSPLHCNCEHRVSVFWPVVGGLALVVSSGGHTGHSLRSADDAKHLALPPIAEELIRDSESYPGGVTVNLRQRIHLLANRQIDHRERAAVRRLNDWDASEALRGITTNSTYSSPIRVRGKGGNLDKTYETSASSSSHGGGDTRVFSTIDETEQRDAELTQCGVCHADALSDLDVRYCAQCHFVYHLRCVSSDSGSPSAVSAASNGEWVCQQCHSENDADDSAVPEGQSVSSRSAGWLPQPSGAICPGSLLTQPQAEYLFRVFHYGTGTSRRTAATGVVSAATGSVSAVTHTGTAVPAIPVKALLGSEGGERGGVDEEMPALLPLVRASNELFPAASITAATTTDSFASAPLPSQWEFSTAFTELPNRVACYARATDESVNKLRSVVQRVRKSGGTDADNTLQVIQRLVQNKWAVVRPLAVAPVSTTTFAANASATAAASTPAVDSALKHLCVFIMSPDMRAYVEAEKARGSQRLSVRVCDATFSIGNHKLQLFGILAIDPETGIAVPVAWFFVGNPVDTDAIEWCFEQCSDAGVPPAFITMFDKDAKEFNALARVSAKRWNSPAGTAARVSIIADLAPLAAIATLNERALASILLEHTPGGSEYTTRTVPPKASALGCSALGVLSAEETNSLQRIFKPELLTGGYGRVLVGLASILHDRLSTRAVPVQPDYSTWHVAMRPLLPFTHFVVLDGPTRSFFDDYCFVFALLCIFHVTQALTRNVLSKRGTTTASQRKQIVADFVEFADTAPAVGWEPLFAAYKAKWEGIVADQWWTYLQTEWLCEAWRPLLFTSERDVFARLYIETTNGIELVWRVFKYDWLLHKRVGTYATCFRLLFGLPWEPHSAFLSLTGRVLFTLVQIRNGLIRPPVRRRVQAMADRIIPLLHRADADPNYLRLDPIDPCWGVISATSRLFASARTSERPLCDVSIAADSSGAISLLTEHRLRSERGCDNAAAVALAVSHIQRIVSGEAAAAQSAVARRAGTTGNARRWDQAASSCDDAVGAILPAILDTDSADRRTSLARTLVDAACATTAAIRHPCDEAQRDFECLRASGRSSGRSKQALTSQGEIVLQYFNGDVFEGMHAFMQHRQATTAEGRAKNNMRCAATFTAGWPMLSCSDFRGSSDTMPRFCIVYVVIFFATVDLWLKECLRLFVRHETRSLVFSEELPDGYVAALFENWPLLTVLTSLGHGNEEFMLPYVGQERHEETAPLTRSAAHGTNTGCPNAKHIMYTSGRGESRRVVSPLGPVRRVERILAVLPLDCPQALNMAESLAVAFCAGSGVVFLNNGPTGNKHGMLDARGDRPATVDVLLRQRIRDWGTEGCSARTVADEPSYWLQRMLAPWEHKWCSGLHLGAPPPAVSPRASNLGVDGNSLSQPLAQTVTTIATARYTILSADAIPVEALPRPKPTYLEVIESWRNPDPDGAIEYEFCLWCSACTCPAVACACKHVLTGRIERLREAMSVVWRDELLGPLTQGREKTLYASASAVVADHDADSDSGAISSESESEGPGRPPRGILKPNAETVGAPFESMLCSKPPTRQRPQIDVATALHAILADSAIVQARTRELMSLLQAENLDLEATKTRHLELCALGMRRERVRLDNLCALVSGAPQASRLGHGNILPPLVSRADGERQAVRLHELGHSMYLPAQVTAPPTALATGNRATTTSSCTVSIALPVTRPRRSSESLQPQSDSESEQSPRHPSPPPLRPNSRHHCRALMSAKCAVAGMPLASHVAIGSLGSPLAGESAQEHNLRARTRHAESDLHVLASQGTLFDASLSMRVGPHGAAATAPPSGSTRRTVFSQPAPTRTRGTDTSDEASVTAKKRAREPDIGYRYTHPAGVSMEQALRDQRAAWLGMVRSIYIPLQHVRESTIGKMLAVFHMSKGTRCTACDSVCWKDPPTNFNPLHFMECSSCGDIACGIGAKI